MKESPSGVQAEGYPDGELKHVSNALVGEHVPLSFWRPSIVLLDDSVLRYEKTLQLLVDMEKAGSARGC